MSCREDSDLLLVASAPPAPAPASALAPPEVFPSSVLRLDRRRLRRLGGWYCCEDGTDGHGNGRNILVRFVFPPGGGGGTRLLSARCVWVVSFVSIGRRGCMNSNILGDLPCPNLP